MYEYFKEILGEGENRYTTYSIRQVGEGAGVRDVSTNEAIAAEIVRKLNESQVEPVHVADVIYDELNKYE